MRSHSHPIRHAKSSLSQRQLPLPQRIRALHRRKKLLRGAGPRPRSPRQRLRAKIGRSHYGELLMAQISARELLARLEKGRPIPAILLLGEETYLRDTCRAQLIDRFVPEAARAWAVSRFSADRGEVLSAVNQAQSLPMLSPQQLVFLEEAEAIESLGDKKREEATKALEAYLEDPAPFTILVLEAANLDQRMRLAKLLVEKSLVVEVGLGEKQDDRISSAVSLARVMAKEDGVEFEKGAPEDLAESVSADLQRLKTEITKLSTYV